MDNEHRQRLALAFVAGVILSATAILALMALGAI
jgi:hypothetical protein